MALTVPFFLRVHQYFEFPSTHTHNRNHSAQTDPPAVTSPTKAMSSTHPRANRKWAGPDYQWTPDRGPGTHLKRHRAKRRHQTHRKGPGAAKTPKYTDGEERPISDLNAVHLFQQMFDLFMNASLFTAADGADLIRQSFHRNQSSFSFVSPAVSCFVKDRIVLPCDKQTAMGPAASAHSEGSTRF